MKRDYELLGYVAHQTALSTNEVESVLFHSSRYHQESKGSVLMICMSCGHKDKSKSTEIRNCPKCNGLFVDAYYKDRLEKVFNNAGLIDSTKDVSEQLLSITLQDETSVPKVIYKGKEIADKQSIQFDWETSDAVSMGGLTYVIEHVERMEKYPTVNRIERRVRGHV